MSTKIVVGFVLGAVVTALALLESGWLVTSQPPFPGSAVIETPSAVVDLVPTKSPPAPREASYRCAVDETYYRNLRAEGLYPLVVHVKELH